MRIIPVLDLLRGQVVRAIAGQREQYRPVVSQLCNSSEPQEVATALLKVTHSQELYIADLDAILHIGHNAQIVEQLQTLNVRLWLDAGFTRFPEVSPTNITPVVGLESLQEFDNINPQCAISIDLHGGKLLGRWPDPFDILGVVQHFYWQDARQFILLDLQQVGTAQGPSVFEHCQQLKQQFPELVLLSGGGVRSVEDVEALHGVGVDGVLVASALHDGLLQL